MYGSWKMLSCRNKFRAAKAFIVISVFYFSAPSPLLYVLYAAWRWLPWERVSDVIFAVRYNISLRILRTASCMREPVCCVRASRDERHISERYTPFSIDVGCLPGCRAGYCHTYIVYIWKSNEVLQRFSGWHEAKCRWIVDCISHLGKLTHSLFACEWEQKITLPDFFFMFICSVCIFVCSVCSLWNSFISIWNGVTWPVAL